MLLTGPREPTSLLLQGGAFGVVAVAVAALRGAPAAIAAVRGLDAGSRERLLVALVMVSLAAVAVGAAPRAPADPRPVRAAHLRRRLRRQRDRTAAGQFRRYTEQRADFPDNVHARPLLRVFGAPEGLRLRFAVLDQYDGTSWHTSDPAHLDADDPDDRYLRVSEEIDGRGRRTRRSPSRCGSSTSGTCPGCPTAGDLTSFEFSFADDDRLEQLRYNPATDGAVMTDRLTPSDDYAFTAVLDDDSLDRSRSPAPTSTPDTARLGGLPRRTACRLGRRHPPPGAGPAPLRPSGCGSSAATPTARSPGRRATDPGHGVDRLGKGFVLTRPTAGNDEQYAATMALAAVRLRHPGPRGGRGGRPPEQRRPRPGRVGLGRGPGGRRRPGGPCRPRSSWAAPRRRASPRRSCRRSATSRNPRARPMPPLPSPQPQPEPERADQDARPDADAGRPDPVALGAAGGAACRHAPGRQAGPAAAPAAGAPGQQRYAGAWHELVDRARDLGIGVPAGITRQAQARAMARGEDLAWLADDAVFGVEEPEPAAAEDYWGRVWAELRAMAAERPRWRRWWAPFNPASLRRP